MVSALVSPVSKANDVPTSEAAPAIPLLFPIGHFYSPIADPTDLKERATRLWSQVNEMPGVAERWGTT
jgi:hypothetical protein